MRTKADIAHEEAEILRLLHQALTSDTSVTAASLVNASGIPRSRISRRLLSLVKRELIVVTNDARGRRRYRDPSHPRNVVQDKPCLEPDCLKALGHDGGHRFGIFVPYSVADLFGFVRKS